MNYIQLHFKTDPAHRDMLIAHLGAAGYEAFEEADDNSLIAGIAEDAFDAGIATEIAARMGISFTTESLPPTNWNAAWESSFQPVSVPGFCTVRAAFHPPASDTPYEIVITPKMSFGTGHHATTRLMMTAMRTLPFEGTSVLDFGTGTGILAVLAAKLGAEHITAIDNDEWSVTNAIENAAANSCVDIRILQGSLEVATDQAFDIVLANINRHILLHYMNFLARLLRPGGTLLLSGILVADEAVIAAAAATAGFTHRHTLEEAGWLAIVLSL